MTDILPTGACFDDALELLNELVQENRALAFVDVLHLVHGIAHSTAAANAGEPYAHAWVEEYGRSVWDAGLVEGQRIYFRVPRDEFYTARAITETTRYTVREACVENLRSGHFGPWRPEYRALCGSGGRVMGAIAATYQPEKK